MARRHRPGDKRRVFTETRDACGRDHLADRNDITIDRYRRRFDNYGGDDGRVRSERFHDNRFIGQSRTLDGHRRCLRRNILGDQRVDDVRKRPAAHENHEMSKPAQIQCTIG